MSLPDLLKDVGSATTSESDSCGITKKTSPLLSSGEACKPKAPLRQTLSAGGTSTCTTTPSITVDFEWESDSVSSLDEGEAAWDALGRMNSIRRSNRFDKPQLLTVELHRTVDGFGLELEGKGPPIIHAVSGEAESKGLRAGDMLLEVNGASVKDCSHQEAGKLIAKDSSMGVVLLIRTVKPTITPSGKVVYADWLYKKGGTGLTPRNWRKRWFVVRDDCVAYYYPSSEDNVRPLGAIVLHNYTISKAASEAKKLFCFKAVKGGARTYLFAAEDETAMNRWAQVFTEAANLENREQVHITGSAQNVSVSALSIKDPECHGFVYKQGKGLLSWKRIYCILKCQQLFFYTNMADRMAQGVLNLESYDILSSKTKDKKYYFQAVPRFSSLKTICFYCETETDRERWIEAMVQSAQGPTPLQRTT